MTRIAPAWWHTPPPGSDQMVWETEPVVAFPDTGITRPQAFTIAQGFGFGSLDDTLWVDLRARRAWFRWAAEESVRDWRIDHCRCYTPNGARRCPGEALCPVPWPRDIWQVWGECGVYCPWQLVPKATPGAQRWWVVYEKGYYPFNTGGDS